MMRHLRVWTALAAVVLWGLAFAAQAEDYRDKWSPAQEEFDMTRPGSMGRAFIAIAEDNAAALYNPAGMAQKNIFNLSFEGAINPQNGRTMSYAGSILDSVARPLVMELAYSFQRYDTIQDWAVDKTMRELSNNYGGNTTSNADNALWLNYAKGDLKQNSSKDQMRAILGRYVPGQTDRHTLRMALGGSLGDYFHMGTTIKYTNVKRPGRAELNRVNADLGFLLTTDVGLRIGTVLYNLSPWTYQQWPLKFGFGFAYVIKEELYLDADLVSTFNPKAWREKRVNKGPVLINTAAKGSTPHYLVNHILREYNQDTTLSPRFGAEYIILKMVALRTGYEWDQYDNLHYVTGGLAFTGEGYSLGVGYSQSLPSQAKRSLMFNFDFQL